MKCSDHTLLFADDEPAIRRIYQRSFEKDGFKVLLCEDAYQVLARLKEQKVDLMVLDLQMPGMDKMDIFSTLKSEYPSVPLMIVSGQYKGLVEDFAAKGYDTTTFFNKPVALAALKESLFKILKIQAVGSYLEDKELG